MTEHTLSNTEDKVSWLVWVVSLVAVLPLFLAHYPLGVDIPQHAGQIALFREMQNPAFIYSSLFKIHLMTPYLLGYIIIYVLSMLMSIALAIKLVLAGSMMALPIATGRLLKALGSCEAYALLAIPVIYGFSFNWGFLNFLVAMPVGLAFLASMVRRTQSYTWCDDLKMALLINALFFCHALVWAFFFGITVLYVLCRERRPYHLFKLIWPLLTSLPVVIGWFYHTMSNSHSAMASMPNYAMGLWRLNPLPLVFGSGNMMFNLGLALGILVLPRLMGARHSKEPARYMPLLASIIVVEFFPHAIFGIAFIYERFAPVLIPFYLLTLEAPQANDPVQYRGIAWLGVAGIILLFVSNEAVMMNGFNSESAGFERIMQQMDNGKRVLMLMFMRGSDYSPAPVYLHFPLWYQAEKQGLVEFNAASEYTPWVQFKSNMLAPADVQGFEWNPQLFDWNRTQANLYDYFVIRAPIAPGQYIFKSHLCQVQMIANVGNWWLYGKRSVFGSGACKFRQ